MVAKAAWPTAKKTGAGNGCGVAHQKRFKGVRMRAWGKWVSEIRLPNTRARLWLGSYATAEQAARAFDVAVVCLRGRAAPLNFPDSPPSDVPLGLPHHQIQELAAAAAAATTGDAPAASPACPSEESLDDSSVCWSGAATNSTESNSSECATSDLYSAPSDKEVLPDLRGRSDLGAFELRRDIDLMWGYCEPQQFTLPADDEEPPLVDCLLWSF